MEPTEWLNRAAKAAKRYCRPVHLWNPIAASKWTTARLPVLEWYQIPESCREPGILHGYRPDDCSWSDCWASLFSANNETFNVWSHVVAFAYFAWRTVRLAEEWGYINQTNEEAFAGDYYRVFIVYLITACLYPLMSAIAHGIAAKSHRARTICFFMDYAAISYYSFGCALLYRAYAIPERWMTAGWTNFFLGFAAFLSLASTLLTCSSRTVVSDVVQQRIMRLAAFTLPYIWDTIPLAVRLVACSFDYSTSAECAASAPFHCLQILFALAASFAYSSHLPERIFPGTFDYVGHSHNLLHVCGAMATAFQLEASLIDLALRQDRLESANFALTDVWWTITVPVAVLIGHVWLLIFFSRYVVNHPIDKQKSKCH